MPYETTAPERKPGERCCLPPGTEALDDVALEALTADLEILAHPIRLRLLSVLAQAGEPACVCDLEAVVPVKQPTVSHHLRLLRSAGLVHAERRGGWTYHSIDDDAWIRLRRRIGTGLSRLGADALEEHST